MTLEEAARDLYGLDPTEFVAARDARVAAAKAAGDKELAAAIGKLRKPTVTAWTVNLLARSSPDDVAALLRLGAALRTAQRELSGDQLRSLGAQRQQVVNALATRAGSLAAEYGRAVGETVLREVSRTLTAALADPTVAEQIRTATLASAASYEGFGPAGPTLVAVPDTAPAEPATPAPSAPPESADDSARRELDDALADLESACTARDSARDEIERATNALTAIESRLTELRAELAHTEQQRQFARTAERGAQEQLRSAQRQLDRVERRARRARERVGED
ncbi:hypothetical protein [Nocardia sp. NPDC050710]|uniref:hypothetical protein n=1 Tax=Nocardia sp. NPDC050710 TaxID=3157220 RepID=UPI0033C0A542